MSDFFEVPTVSAAGSLLVLGVLVAVGLWLVSIFHGHDDDDRETPELVLSNFEEMLREGDISETEFRTIEAVVGDKPTSNVQDSGKEDSY